MKERREEGGIELEEENFLCLQTARSGKSSEHLSPWNETSESDQHGGFSMHLSVLLQTPWCGINVGPDHLGRI